MKRILIGTLLFVMSVGVSYGATLDIGGEYYWLPNHPEDVQSYMIRWGETQGTYPQSLALSGTSDKVPFSALSYVEGKTYYAILEAHLVGGAMVTSEELKATIFKSQFESQFCLRGTLNGSPVDMCVPMVISPSS
jgi:hypothetical protein